MRYSIDARRISHERLGDEVIIINVTSGAYYAGSGTAADLWTLITQGASIEEAATLLAAVHGCDRQSALRDVKACLDVLVTRAVLQQDDRSNGREATLALPEIDRGPWVAPFFSEYLDMWDLIQLDPIHDVGDAGWPFAAPTSRI
jgi:hypothetical protein